MQNWIEILQDFKKDNTPVALVTITKCLGSTPCKVGARMIVQQNGTIIGTVGGGKLEFNIITDAQKVLQENSIKNFAYTLGPDFEQCCGGKVELIIEPMNTNPNLYICGAGHIGVELCNILKDTPFQTTLMDTREGWKSTIEIHDNIKYSAIDFDFYKQEIKWNDNCYIIIVTHDHKLDFEITALALHEKTKFIGLIGSQTKKVKFNNMLQKDLNFLDGMKNVKCPVGVNIGGITPNEIAISIAAELLQVYYGK